MQTDKPLKEYGINDGNTIHMVTKREPGSKSQIINQNNVTNTQTQTNSNYQTTEQN
jgi:hypothetical protein